MPPASFSPDIADGVIQQEEDNLPHEEIVVQNDHERRHQRERDPPLLLQKVVKCDYIQRKERHHIMKVLENNIAGLKPGKRIEQRTDQRRPVRLRSSADQRESGQRGSAVFCRHQKRQKIWNRCLRKRNREPEKRTSPEIKRKAPAHAPAEVHIRTPEQPPFPDRPVRKNIERHLLDVIIPVIEKDPAVINQKRNHTDHIQDRSEQKRRPVRMLHHAAPVSPYRNSRCGGTGRRNSISHTLLSSFPRRRNTRS